MVVLCKEISRSANLMRSLQMYVYKCVQACGTGTYVAVCNHGPDTLTD